MKEISKEERWLFDSKNEALAEELKVAIKSKDRHKIDLSEFEED